MTNDLPPLEVIVNIEEDCTRGGFIVVEKNIYEYDNDSFKSFVSSLGTLKGAIFANQFNTILDNMIKPLVN